jgi:hypothetical protein
MTTPYIANVAQIEFLPDGPRHLAPSLRERRALRSSPRP